MSSEISEKFREFLKSSEPKKKTKQNKFGMLQELQEEVREARKLGYSFKEIAEFLTKSGAQVAAHQVQGYCREVLKEKPLYKRNKKLDKKKEAIQKETTAEATRVQISSQEASLMSSATVVHAQQKSNETVAGGRVGPRPGFRIARDDL